MRNKSNRLEELFLALVNDGEEQEPEDIRRAS